MERGNIYLVSLDPSAGHEQRPGGRKAGTPNKTPRNFWEAMLTAAGGSTISGA